MKKIGGIIDVAPDETKLSKIHKHPFGLAIVYFEILLGLGITLVLMQLAVGNVISADYSNQVLALAIVFVVMAWLGLLVYTFIYNQTYILLTDKNLTMVLQRGLFNNKVSELALANVEDVTANRKGIFSTIFNYGVLLVETAGEAENFVFAYCPNPNYYGKIILEARQNFMRRRSNKNDA